MPPRLALPDLVNSRVSKAVFFGYINFARRLDTSGRFILSEFQNGLNMNPKELKHLIRRTLEELLEDFLRAIKHGQHDNKRIRRLVIVIHPLEPIKKAPNMEPLNLGQIPLGKRAPVDFVPDEPVDVKSDGLFMSVAVTSGDATAFVDPKTSTNKKSTVYFNGDGAVGLKSATVAMDGHVGPEDVEIEQVVNWEVTSPDATTFAVTVRPLEDIPTA